MALSDADNRSAGAQPEWDRLELGIRRLLDEHAALQRRARGAERRVKELEAMLADVSGGLDPAELSAEVERLESRNAELVERLEQARAHVNVILTRLQLLEDDR
jgi:chromosome segregation ATPase